MNEGRYILGDDGPTRAAVIDFTMSLAQRLSLTPNLQRLCAAGFNPAYGTIAEEAEEPRIILPGDPEFDLE